MARRDYDALSAGYRGRLERAGMTRAEYERGDSLKSARGHSQTPERPSRALNRPEAYPDYIARRFALERRVIARKAEIFGTGPKFNAQRSRENLRSGPKTEQPASMAAMERFAELGEDLFDEPDFDWQDNEWDFLYYH